jgi:hypothetical protein
MQILVSCSDQLVTQDRGVSYAALSLLKKCHDTSIDQSDAAHLIMTSVLAKDEHVTAVGKSFPSMSLV